MKKYLFIMVQEGYPWGGSEELWASAAEHLAREGNEVRISAKDWGRPVAQIERLRSAGCKIFYRPDRYAIPPFFQRQVRRIFRRAPYVRTHVGSVGGDADLIVISQGSNWDGLEWLEAARASGRKYGIIAQAAAAYWWPADDLGERVRTAYEQASAAYFVSQENLELSRYEFGSPLRNAKVVRNAFNVRYDACPAWPGDGGDGLALACVARFDLTQKAHDVLFQVLALPHWRQRKIGVSVYGEGPNERGVHYIAQRLGLTNVDFRGRSDDIENVWGEHHALVLPSRFEGMPLVVVEAMLCGRPCIVTDVGGNTELVRDGVNGFVAKAPTVELFDDAMNRAWENRQRLREMGEAAARDVRQWVSPDPGGDLAQELASLAEAAKQGEEGHVVGSRHESMELSR